MKPVQTPPRAPARELTRDEKVAYLLRLIADGRLLTRHDMVLAKRWELEPSRVREMIAEARRAWRIGLDPERLEDIREETLCRLDRIYALGMRTGDLGAALGALRERARIAGLGKEDAKGKPAGGKDLRAWLDDKTN